MKKIINVLLDCLFGTLRMSFSDKETDRILKDVDESRDLKRDDKEPEK